MVRACTSVMVVCPNSAMPCVFVLFVRVDCVYVWVGNIGCVQVLVVCTGVVHHGFRTPMVISGSKRNRVRFICA